MSAPPTPFVPVLSVGDPVPAVVLRDQRGRDFVPGSRRGVATAVAFVYTRCREVNECPLVSAKFARLQAVTRPDELRLIEITVDPDHDSPATLARYAASFHADPNRWSLLTGAPGDVRALEARLGAEASVEPNGEIAHSETLVLLDRRGLVADRIEGTGWTPDQIAAEARSLDGRGGDWLAQLGSALTRGVSGFCGGSTGGLANWVVLTVLLCALGGFGYAFRRAIRIPA